MAILSSFILPPSSLLLEVSMPASFVENYKEKHQHPLNRLAHSIGIPLILISLPLSLFNWRWALALFIVGWALQFLGHAIEGNQPAFFHNPVYLLVGPWWLVRRLGVALGLVKRTPARQPTENL
jgi:uncharacterized membrane protein YGL010W